MTVISIFSSGFVQFHDVAGLASQIRTGDLQFVTTLETIWFYQQVRNSNSTQFAMLREAVRHNPVLVVTEDEMRAKLLEGGYVACDYDFYLMSIVWQSAQHTTSFALLFMGGNLAGSKKYHFGQ